MAWFLAKIIIYLVWGGFSSGSRPLTGRLAGDEAGELDRAVVGELLGAGGDPEALGDRPLYAGHRQRGASGAFLPVRGSPVRRRRGILAAL